MRVLGIESSCDETAAALVTSDGEVLADVVASQIATHSPYGGIVPELASRGIRRLAVLCPSFVADCLETLEEIGIRAREQWMGVGGEDFLMLPSLNSEPCWVEAVAGMIREHAQ